MLDKRDRVEQLKKLGFNVPRMLRIPAGSTLDAMWFRRMDSVRQGDHLVTVRSYHPTDELHRTDLPRLLGGEIPAAIELVQRLVPTFHVLWQEWIPVEGTLLCGNILLEPDGGGYIEAARGEYEVRAVNELRVPERDRLTIRFNPDTITLNEPDLDHLLAVSRRAARLLRQDTGIVIEFNVQAAPVGEARDRLIFWEWRPMVMRRKPLRRRRFPALRELGDILTFGGPEGTGVDDRNLVGAIGNKALHLLRMAALGMKVPPGFVIPITVCREIARTGEIPPSVHIAFQSLRERTKASLGGRVPALWSIRSSPTVSLPGLLHTVLNVGIDAEALSSIQELPLETQRSIVAEYILSYAGAMRVLSEQQVERILTRAEADRQTMHGKVRAWREALRELDLALPVLVDEQIDAAILAVVRSASEVFAAHTNMEGAATAVVVQRMVFGNWNERSGTGVMHSRNPLVPGDEPVVEFVPVAQGPQLVSGRRTPGTRVSIPGGADLHRELVAAARKLESAFHDMQEIEFTIQSGELWLLQSRRGERSPSAAVYIAHALMQEGVIDQDAALSMLDDIDVRELLPEIVLTDTEPIARGRSASAGVAIGRLVTPSTAGVGPDQILFVRRVDDVPHLVEAASGIVSLQGGTTSHGAVLARSYDVPVVVAVEPGELVPDGFLLDGHLVRVGEWVTIDGTRGLVFLGVQEIGKTATSVLDRELIERYLARRARNDATQRPMPWG
jgi:pyruvate, orthophosphate dikinase